MIATVNHRTGRTSCARISVPFLFKDGVTSAPLSPEGKRYPAATECTCFLFDHLDAAQEFCEMKVKGCPSMVCEIFNSEGRAKPPLL
jgi:hypothetical protein